MRLSNDRGIALITALLVMMLISALLVGFTTVVMTDQRYRFIDKDRGQAFYAATGAVEKMTADLGNTFLKNVAPTNAQITALTAVASQPVIPNVTFTSTNAPDPLPASELSIYDCNNSDGVARTALTVGANGYTIKFCALTATTNPTTLPFAKTIHNANSPFDGLYALKMPYQIDVTAKTASGGEVHLSRTMEAVSIPVFQFGIFSDVDLAFNAAEDFAFGGRVHTNGYLFLAEGAGNTLTLSDKVTAYKDVIRSVLSNGNAIGNANDTGTVNMTKGNGTFRALASTEGSVQGGPGSTPYAGWTSLSLSTYKGYIKDGAAGAARGTGAKQLNLPIVAPGVGGTNIDIIRRPRAGEDTTSILYQERMFTKASIRVLLSDTAADITTIPGVDNGAPPLSLEAGNTYGGIPIATSPGTATFPATAITAISNSSPGTGRTMTFAALPAAFIPNLTATSAGNQWTITGCTTKTTSTFTGCTVTAVGAAPATVPIGATIAVSGRATPTAALQTAAVLTGANRTINVAANATLPFSLNTFWVDDMVVTCTGYTATTVTGCTTQSTIVAGGATPDKIQNFSVSPAGTSLVGGWIKIERQNANDSTWHDITPEILNWGIAAPAEYGSCVAAQGTAPYGANLDPSPNAIIRLQRLQDDATNPLATGCMANSSGANGSTAARLRDALATDFWPTTLFDTREAWQRETAPAGSNIKVSGVMHYVAIDATNLAKWFAGQAPYNAVNPIGGLAPTGTLSKPDNTGYSIYISDRRNNRDAASAETAEFGFEDYVNPASATAVPNGALDAGEDVNANALLDVYGGLPSCNGTANYVPGNAAAGIVCASATAFTNPWTPNLNSQPDLVVAGDSANVNGVGRAMVNRPLFFRRAVKLIRGATIGTILNGFTVVTENPVYLQGDWNANGGFNNPHAATAILADAVTILSNAWDDRNSFLNPYTANGNVGGGRLRSATSWYRVAVLAGKGPIFPMPAGTGATFGTDGGAHSFLRFLEGNNNPGAPSDTINYMGSMATLFYNRQALGIFKGNNGFVYGIPATRNYTFDQDFLDPSKLPPLTPMFRDMDATGFSQNLQPGK